MTDLAQTVDSVQPNRLDLIVEHIDQEVLRLLGKLSRVGRQLTQRVNGGVPYLCVTPTPLLHYY